MVLYRILLATVALATAVFLFFFLWGVGDGTVSADNIALWLAILAIPAAVMFASHRLAARGQRAAASVLLSLLAIPATLVGLFFLILILAAPDWK